MPFPEDNHNNIQEYELGIYFNVQQAKLTEDTIAIFFCITKSVFAESIGEADEMRKQIRYDDGTRCRVSSTNHSQHDI